MAAPVNPSADTPSARFRKLSAVMDQCPNGAQHATAYEQVTASNAVRVAWGALECTGDADDRQHFVAAKAKKERELSLEDWLTLDWGELKKRI